MGSVKRFNNAEKTGPVCGPISAQPHAIPWSIRLIRLRPSFDLSPPLELNLLEVLLEDFPSKVNSYEPLSYVWGAPTGTVPCRSEGKELLITPNCNEALQHLRLPDNDRVLWVDAICIDQGNSEESSLRLEQVCVSSSPAHNASDVYLNSTLLNYVSPNALMFPKVQFLTQPHFIVQSSPQTLFESMRPVEIDGLLC